MYYPINYDEIAFLNEVQKGDVEGNLILVDPELVDDLSHCFSAYSVSEDFIISCLDKQEERKVTKQFTINIVDSWNFEWAKKAVYDNLNTSKSIENPIVKLYSNTIIAELKPYSVEEFIELDRDFLNSLTLKEVEILYEYCTYSLEKRDSDTTKYLLNFLYRTNRSAHEFVAGYSLAIDNLGLELFACFFDLTSKNLLKNFLEEKQKEA